MNKLLILSTSLLLLLAACAPRTQGVSANPEEAAFSSPAAQETSRIATAAYHRMELAQLEEGAYTTNVLINLELPRGVRWMLEDLNDDSYTLRFTSTDVPDAAWIVTPEGVEPRQEEEGTTS